METEQTLGYKTLRFSLFRNSIGAVALSVLSIIILFARGEILNAIPFDMMGVEADTALRIVNSLTGILSVVSLLILLTIVVVTWIIYIHTTFVFNQYALKIKTGFIHKREILIPYRQIQNVNINRSLLHRMLGVSNLVILTAGSEDQTPDTNQQESEGVFDLLDAELAGHIQSELVKRASVQMVSDIGPHPQATLPV